MYINIDFPKVLFCFSSNIYIENFIWLIWKDNTSIPRFFNPALTTPAQFWASFYHLLIELHFLFCWLVEKIIESHLLRCRACLDTKLEGLLRVSLLEITHQIENILKALLTCIQICNMPALNLVCFWIKQVLSVLIVYILCCHVVLLASILESGRVRSPLDEKLILKVRKKHNI